MVAKHTWRQTSHTNTDIYAIVANEMNSQFGNCSLVTHALINCISRLVSCIQLSCKLDIQQLLQVNIVVREQKNTHGGILKLADTRIKFETASLGAFSRLVNCNVPNCPKVQICNLVTANFTFSRLVKVQNCNLGSHKCICQTGQFGKGFLVTIWSGESHAYLYML